MTSHDNRPQDSGFLRAKAEETARVRVPGLNDDIESLTPDEIRRLLHESRVRQIELELRNEELRGIEHALRESESRYRRITEGLTDYQYTVRINEGHAVETIQGPACVAVTGYSPEEFAEDPHLWIRMVAPEDRELVMDRVRQILAGKEIPPIEHRIMRKDGETRWVCDTTILFKDASGVLLSYDGVIKDITETRQAGDALRSASLYARNLIETSLDPLVTISREGKITDANAATLRITGVGRERLIGSDFSGYFTEPDKARAGYQEVFALGQIVDYPLAIRQASGEITEVLYNASVYRNEQGEILGVFAAARDVTDRKRAEDALRESEERFRTICENAPMLIDGFDKDGRCVLWNRECEKLFGWTMDDINAQAAPFELFYPDLETRMRAAHSVTSNPERAFMEWRPVARDGTKLSVLWANFQLPGGHVISIGYDITDRKRAEAEKEALEAQNRQLQKSESLGRMAGAIAHHFNNQLQVVAGNLEMALDERSGSPEEMTEFLTSALSAARHASEVSSLMLTYLGQAPGKRESLDLSAACRQGLPILAAVMPGNVVFTSDLPDPGPIIKGNASQIQQVLTNLLTNAWEAGEGASCEIHLRVKKVSSEDITEEHCFPLNWRPLNSKYACLEIQDTGQGIAAGDMESLFDPFFTTKFPGRGMGLPAVLGIMRSYEGAVTVESKPGRGSIFRAYMALAPEGILRIPVQTVQSMKDISWGRVLVVDDEEMVRTLASAMLTRLGFTVLSAKDGRAAMDILKQDPDGIRCVLCDLTMPYMDGWETLHALREIAPGIPVILASGYNVAQVVEGEHTEMPQAILHKPYRREQLYDAIMQALAGDANSIPDHQAAIPASKQPDDTKAPL